ncbi:hypothetical protein BC830DRAFT_1170687 [Chytriomyces sp. MP71]|nr:hypothetical protein BC830DRAFT_1170687 [Chytriomyces sp. MP71]
MTTPPRRSTKRRIEALFEGLSLRDGLTGGRSSVLEGESSRWPSTPATPLVPEQGQERLRRNREDETNARARVQASADDDSAFASALVSAQSKLTDAIPASAAERDREYLLAQLAQLSIVENPPKRVAVSSNYAFASPSTSTSALHDWTSSSTTTTATTTSTTIASTLPASASASATTTPTASTIHSSSMLSRSLPTLLPRHLPPLPPAMLSLSPISSAAQLMPSPLVSASPAFKPKASKHKRSQSRSNPSHAFSLRTSHSHRLTSSSSAQSQQSRVGSYSPTPKPLSMAAFMRLPRRSNSQTGSNSAAPPSSSGHQAPSDPHYLDSRPSFSHSPTRQPHIHHHPNRARSSASFRRTVSVSPGSSTGSSLTSFWNTTAGAGAASGSLSQSHRSPPFLADSLLPGSGRAYSAGAASSTSSRPDGGGVGRGNSPLTFQSRAYAAVAAVAADGMVGEGAKARQGGGMGDGPSTRAASVEMCIKADTESGEIPLLNGFALMDDEETSPASLLPSLVVGADGRGVSLHSADEKGEAPRSLADDDDDDSYYADADNDEDEDVLTPAPTPSSLASPWNNGASGSGSGSGAGGKRSSGIVLRGVRIRRMVLRKGGTGVGVASTSENGLNGIGVVGSGGKSRPSSAAKYLNVAAAVAAASSTSSHAFHGFFNSSNNSNNTYNNSSARFGENGRISSGGSSAMNPSFDYSNNSDNQHVNNFGFSPMVDGGAWSSAASNNSNNDDDDVDESMGIHDALKKIAFHFGKHDERANDSTDSVMSEVSRAEKKLMTFQADMFKPLTLISSTVLDTLPDRLNPDHGQVILYKAPPSILPALEQSSTSIASSTSSGSTSTPPPPISLFTFTFPASGGGAFNTPRPSPVSPVAPHSVLSGASSFISSKLSRGAALEDEMRGPALDLSSGEGNRGAMNGISLSGSSFKCGGSALSILLKGGAGPGVGGNSGGDGGGSGFNGGSNASQMDLD